MINCDKKQSVLTSGADMPQLSQNWQARPMEIYLSLPFHSFILSNRMMESYISFFVSIKQNTL